MSKRKQTVHKNLSDSGISSTIVAFEQLLALYREKVWEVKITPTLLRPANTLAELL